MREAGWPEWNLLGGATNGWTLPPLDGPRAGYEVLAPEHWAFRDPRPVATGFPFAPDAAGYETDLSIRSMFERFGRGKMTRYPARTAASAEPEEGFDEPDYGGERLKAVLLEKLPEAYRAELERIEILESSSLL